jgi:hypothetical protein
MKSKYIKGTNKQYSIREDGFVLKNYKYQRISNTRKDLIVTNNVLKYISKSTVNIKVNNKIRRLSIYKLMHEYFGFAYCKLCNNKFKYKTSPITCDKCRKESRKKSVQKDYEVHKKERLIRSILYSKVQSNKLSDRYIHNCLNIRQGNLPKKLIELKRNQIKLHRELKKQEKL